METSQKRISFYKWSNKSHNKRWLKVLPKKRRGKVFKHGKLLNQYKNGIIF